MITELSELLMKMPRGRRKKCVEQIKMRFGVTAVIVRNWRYGQQIPFYIRQEVMKIARDYASWRE